MTPRIPQKRIVAHYHSQLSTRGVATSHSEVRHPKYVREI